MLQMEGATLRNEIEQRLCVELFQFREAHATARPYRREASSQGRTNISLLGKTTQPVRLASAGARIPSESLSLPRQRPATRCDRRSVEENVAPGPRLSALRHARWRW